MRLNSFCYTSAQNRGLKLRRVFYMKPNSALERPLFQVSPQNLLARKCQELGVENQENAGAMRGFTGHPFFKFLIILRIDPTVPTTWHTCFSKQISGIDRFSTIIESPIIYNCFISHHDHFIANIIASSAFSKYQTLPSSALKSRNLL